MPSLHAALAIFVAWYGIRRLRTGLRWLLLLYPLAMSFMLVYYAEHYVVDIVAGERPSPWSWPGARGGSGGGPRRSPNRSGVSGTRHTAPAPA